jgi:hypothetical protein
VLQPRFKGFGRRIFFDDTLEQRAFDAEPERVRRLIALAMAPASLSRVERGEQGTAHFGWTRHPRSGVRSAHVHHANRDRAPCVFTVRASRRRAGHCACIAPMLPLGSARRSSVARRRFQTGQLYKKGKRRKVWIARWREDVLLPDGTIGRVRRGILLGAVADLPTRRDAQVRLDERLRPVNQGLGRPESIIGFGAFVEQQWKVLALPNFKRTT